MIIAITRILINSLITKLLLGNAKLFKIRAIPYYIISHLIKIGSYIHFRYHYFNLLGLN